jgi:hypothetical protein
MESVAARPLIRGFRPLQREDLQALWIWLLAGGTVLYLALDGGGYDLIVRNQVGLIIWWVVLLGSVAGLLPVRALGRGAWAAMVLLAAFVVWTCVAATWSHSTERSLQELSRVACYLGVVVLALAIHRDRDHAVRHTIGAIASVIVIVACAALLSELRPGTFSGSTQTASLLPGTRLSWPLNYWNALAALMALGAPLLLSMATTSRRLAMQAVSAGSLPLVALCGYLTFSRGGAVAAAGGLLVFFVFAEDRLHKLLSALVAAGGSAILIAGAVHRSAVEKGLTNSVAVHQGRQLIVAAVLVAVGVALAQVGIGLAVRHGTRPRWSVIPIRFARVALAAAIVAAVAIALAVHVPHRLSHAWHDFKKPTSSSLAQNGISRFGSISGNGRYQYWKVAVQASGKHLVGGWGPGTFQYVYLQRAPTENYVQNAHSLYLETLVEDGVVGLALLLGFFVVAFGATGRLAVRGRYEQRTRGAAALAACTAFAISAALDWVWQVPAVTLPFLLLVAAALAPRPAAAARLTNDVESSPPRRSRFLLRALLAGAAVLAMVAIVVPLSTASALRKSQTAAAIGDNASALSYAELASQLEPDAASPQLQQALLLELDGRLPSALAAAQRATADEPMNWGAWFVRFRLEAENGHPAAALAAFKRARSLNPHSPVFRQ